MNYVHLKGAYLTSPPFSEDTLLMLATGWDYPTLQVTPPRIIGEMKIYLDVVAEYERQKAADGQDG